MTIAPLPELQPLRSRADETAERRKRRAQQVRRAEVQTMIGAAIRRDRQPGSSLLIINMVAHVPEFRPPPRG